ncbi:MAG: hypothetical protein HY738_12875 [Bacteroidia bacterium]|nr:hypothetical protein [Bacteroidia bacterium]
MNKKTNNFMQFFNNLLIFIILFLNVSCAQNTRDKYEYWEDLSDVTKSELLQDSSIIPVARQFYLGNRFMAAYTDSTISVLDTITYTPDDKNRCFYLHLLDTITEHTEGIVAEYIGINWVILIKKNRNFSISTGKNN